MAAISTLTAALNSRTITPDLIAAFAAYGLSLDSSATIKVNAPQPGQGVNSWTISAGGFKYQVTFDSHGVLTVEASGGSMSALNGPVRIEAAVTLGIEGVPPAVFSATGDVIIETDGKILLNAFANFGGGGGDGSDVNLSNTINFRAFVDLSHADSAVTTLFYFEKDINLPDNITVPQFIIAGGVTFGKTDAQGNFVVPGGPYANDPVTGFGINLNGEVVYYPIEEASITLTGGATLIFTPTQMSVTFDATLSASLTQFIQVNNLVTAAGSFTVQYAGSFAIWGAAELYFGSNAIPFLQSAGIQSNAEIFLRINSDIQNAHNVSFNLPMPGNANAVIPEHFTLQPLSFGLYVVGVLSFKQGPVDFELDGVFDIDFKFDAGNWTFDIFAFAQLNLGIAGQNILKLDALGLVQVDSSGFAAMLSIFDGGNFGVLQFNAQFTLFVNTTGQLVTYTLPPDLTDILEQMSGVVPTGNNIPAAPVVSAGLLTDLETELQNLSTMYGTGNGNYVVTNGGSLTISIPAGMPQFNEGGAVTGDAAPARTWSSPATAR